MKQYTEMILFLLVPLFIIVLFVSSGESIIPFLDNTFITNSLYALSYPNTIAFNLSIGYLTGVFIYYLTGHIPAKNREQEQNIITTRLLNQLKSRIDSLFRTILNCSTEQEENMDKIDDKRFKDICKQCDINVPTGAKKTISQLPLELGDLLLRDSLINDWNFILSHLSEIDNVSSYIRPEHYNACLKIKKCSLAFTIIELGMPIQNTDLEAWSSQFFDLYKIGREINEIIKSIEKK